MRFDKVIILSSQLFIHTGIFTETEDKLKTRQNSVIFVVANRLKDYFQSLFVCWNKRVVKSKGLKSIQV